MAVYTKVEEAEAAAFLKDYDLGALESLSGIKSGVENSNYLLRTARGPFILTLYEKRVREADLPFFLGLMDHLARQGVPCPLPMRNAEGSAIGHLNSHAAAIVGFLEGASIQLIDPPHCAELGRALAQMHLAAADFPLRRKNDLSLDGWGKLVEACASRADEIRLGLADIIRTEFEFLRAHWPQRLPRGVIHADLFPNNVFFNNGALCGVIDFYFACEDWLAYDIAICLNAWCFERDVSFNITKARALLKGYEGERLLSKAEKAALPVLARGSALRFLLTRLYDALNRVEGALVKTLDPLDYLTRLQFHQRVTDVSAYGMEP